MWRNRFTTVNWIAVFFLFAIPLAAQEASFLPSVPSASIASRTMKNPRQSGP